MKFNYYGHSAFTLSDDVTTILFDPFITDNPWTDVCRRILPVNTSSSPTVTATTTAMLKRLPKPMTQRLSARQKSREKQEMPAVRPTPCTSAAVPLSPLAGCVSTPPSTARALQADWPVVSSSSSAASAFTLPVIQALLRYENSRPLRSNRLCHFAHWRQLHHGHGRCGSGSLMGAAPFVIPIHYKTWPIIEADPQEYKKLTETKYNIPVQVVEPGTTYEF